MSVTRWLIRYKLGVVAIACAGCAAAGSVAAAASSPAVATGRADDVTQSAASLLGTVNPNGSSTTYYFQWGPTTGYGVQHSAASAGSGTKAVSVSQTASGLNPGTIYHYRLLATNQFGTTVGSDRAFKTAGSPPPGVSTGPVTHVSTRGGDLTGTVNPSSQATSWYFEWGATSKYGQQTAARTLAASGTPQSVAVSLQGLLAPGTIYHYRLVASHSGFPPSIGGDATFMTYPSPRPVPAVSASTQPRRARHRPYMFTTAGQVIGPSSIPAQYACQGNVTIRFFRGVREVAVTLAAVQPTCGFSAQTRITGLRRHGRRPIRLRVVIRYVSTPYLATNRASYEHLRLG
jgi:hypothetical protein